jgi:hypothetical protein
MEGIMPGFVFKVTKAGGDLMHPITVYAKDAQSAEDLVRTQSFIDAGDKVEHKQQPDKIMKDFGPQADDTVVVRIDWVWSGQEPVKKTG